MGQLKPDQTAIRGTSRVSLSAIERYVRSCFANESPLRVWGLARALKVSRGTLNSATKALLDTTPAEYLRARQLGRAKQLLEKGVPIERVARRAGYGTARTLVRSFRAATGRTPSAYRFEQNVQCK